MLDDCIYGMVDIDEMRASDEQTRKKTGQGQLIKK
jgi:hypothetical protein